MKSFLLRAVELAIATAAWVAVVLSGVNGVRLGIMSPLEAAVTETLYLLLAASWLVWREGKREEAA